jgi:hypothetical protein
MARLIVLAIACGVWMAGSAAAAPLSAGSDLTAAAFVSRPAAIDRTVEQRLSSKNGREIYLYAGGGNPQPRLRADARWTPDNNPSQASSFVNTKLGVGWRREGLETSVGYQVMKRTSATYGQRPRKASMLGVNLKYRPGF